MLESAQVSAPVEVIGGFLFDPPPDVRESNAHVLMRPPRVSDLAAAVPGALVRPADDDRPVTDVTYRSSHVTPGALFFCVPGFAVDGHDFATRAVEGGAVALVVDRWLEVGGDVAQILVPSVREAMGPVSSAFFGRPSERLSMTGVTGTNGKTTTTYLLESIFRAAGLVPGVVGTTGVRVDGEPRAFERTTPEAPDLQRLLAGMVEAGVRAVAMEVSSHGLHQHRVDGTRYACAVFTNLTQDHLDYHPSMEEYFEAKARLFTPSLSERGAVNADSPHGRMLAERSGVPVVTFGVQTGADLRATDVEVTATGLSFVVDGVRVRSRLRGTFNVENCLGAFAAARQLGLPDDAAIEGIATLAGVPGRVEPVEAGQSFPVLVDYAHTPDSLENVLRTARALTDGRLIVVFGCGGDRDRLKRPLMGEAATRLADLTLITSDNPRSELPGAIIAEIEPGALRGGGRYSVEPDRRAAIHAALAEASPGDVVVVAGKGHESGQTFADRTVPFDDRAVVAEELAALGFGDGR